jgi:hypothetical protein
MLPIDRIYGSEPSTPQRSHRSGFLVSTVSRLKFFTVVGTGAVKNGGRYVPGGQQIKLHDFPA